MLLACDDGWFCSLVQDVPLFEDFGWWKEHIWVLKIEKLSGERAAGLSVAFSFDARGKAGGWPEPRQEPHLVCTLVHTLCPGYSTPYHSCWQSHVWLVVVDFVCVWLAWCVSASGFFCVEPVIVPQGWMLWWDQHV